MGKGTAGGMLEGRKNRTEISRFRRMERAAGTRGARERKASTMGAGRRAFYSLPSRPPLTHAPGLCAFESRGSGGFPGKDVHRFLSSDRPFEQQPTWKTETHPCRISLFYFIPLCLPSTPSCLLVPPSVSGSFQIGFASFYAPTASPLVPFFRL